jgi:2,4-didehydro-3-deoxy-L-rhamnonate hydrolase
MKLIRFGKEGQEQPGVINSLGQRIDVSAFNENYDETFFGSNGLKRLASWLKSHERQCRVISEKARLGPAICRPSKLICVGLNYARRARESKMEIPKQPVIFMKATSSIVGPNNNLIIPRNSTKTDWEVELAVVIGKKGSYINEKDAMNFVAGYVLHNDYSEREFQLEHGGQWVKGKSADTFSPIGPFMATKDEIKNPNQLRLWLKVNGEVKQNSNTSDMLFKVPYLISYISKYMSLLPGDMISTGTPEGVGFGFIPPQYLKPGDVVELGIEKLGTSKQHVKAHELPG